MFKDNVNNGEDMITKKCFIKDDGTVIGAYILDNIHNIYVYCGTDCEFHDEKEVSEKERKRCADRRFRHKMNMHFFNEMLSSVKVKYDL